MTHLVPHHASPSLIINTTGNTKNHGTFSDTVENSTTHIPVVTSSRYTSFACGKNSAVRLGIFNYNNNNMVTPEEMIRLKNFHLKQILCGENFTIALTYDGKVIGWGVGSDGQLGVGSLSSLNQQILQINIPCPIQQIEVGYFHTLALGNDYKLYAWGSNSRGQLGIGRHLDASLSPIIVDTFDIDKMSSNVVNGVQSDNDNSIFNDKIIKVSAKCYHSMALSASGKVFGWGSIGFEANKKFKPHLFEDLITQGRIVDIDCGRSFGVGFTTHNELYAWGSMEYIRAFQYQVKKINTSHIFDQDSTDAIQSVKAGWFHAMILTRNHKVYAFGNNQYGQLGFGEIGSETIFELKQITACKYYNIKTISLGGFHTLIVTEGGKVLSFGDASHGQLGIGISLKTSGKSVFENPVLKHKNVQHISATANSSFFIVRKCKGWYISLAEQKQNFADVSVVSISH